MTYTYTPADIARINRPNKSRCLCGLPTYHKDHHNGYATWPVFIGLFGETVTVCQCGRRLTGRLLDVMSYRALVK